MDETQNQINYRRIEKAIVFIINHIREQPSLEQIAEHVGMSSFHFQRIFSDWAGTSPKKFTQFLHVSYAKKLLQEQKKTLFETHLDLGLSSTSRLHHLFVEIEGMTPAEYKNAGSTLLITYEIYESPFGNCLVASTAKGICCMLFLENIANALDELTRRFPKAQFVQKSLPMHLDAMSIFSLSEDISRIKLHLKGTMFQLKVWEALLRIPIGQLSTYTDIAQMIHSPKASRAVGSAIGSNPIAFLIPCHRVIQSTGIFGGYMWDPNRKAAIIGWEQGHKR